MKATQGDTDRLYALFERAAGLKSTRRTGWVEKLGLDSAESVADHSYAVSFMSAVYADIMGLDSCKMIRMSLLHDLAESITGDIALGSVPEEKKIADEDAAMATILDLFPESIRAGYAELWSEYRAGSSPESAVLRQLDKLEMALQARRYSGRGRSVEPFLDTARNHVRDKPLRQMLDMCADGQR